MIARSESRSPPASAPRAAALAALAVCLFLASWALLHQGFYAREQIVDTPVYEHYGAAVVSGELPYRDFRVEYPPLALPVFALPSLGDGDSDPDRYRRGFEALLAGFGAASLLCVAVVLSALGAGLGRLASGLAFVALAPLALGSVTLSRFDLWPAFLTVAALALLVAGRQRLALGTFGLGVAAKLYPGLLAPLALAYVWRRSGRREALVCAGVLGAVLAVSFGPFLLLAPDGVWESFSRQGSRPLQIESLGSALLLAGHHVFDLGLTMRSSHGSQNLVGAGASALAVAQTALQLAAVAVIWIWFARGPAGRERFLRASAAALCAFVALGKVLSPQFLLWLVPLVPLVRGRRGLAASALLGLALVLTQLWFPYRYWDLALDFDATASWLVLGRDLVLVGVLAVLVWPSRSERPRGGPEEGARGNREVPPRTRAATRPGS